MPSLLVHSTSVCGVTTTHPVAAHDRPAVTYRAVTVWPTDGPKFDPDTCTRVPPDVGMADRLSDPATATSDVMAGAAYDVATLADDSTLVCPPTVTSHRRPDPTPSTLSHDSRVCATSTTQLDAVYVVPLTPYVPTTLTTDPPTGPKFIPVTTTVSPPDVLIVTAPDSDKIDGGVYVIVVDASPLHCSPTFTSHRSPLPTPATD
jgi:hypothetical protein